MNIIGVTVRNNGITQYYYGKNENFRIGDKVLLPTSRGVEMGKVLRLGLPKEIIQEKSYPEIVKKATAIDEENLIKNENDAKEAMSTVKEKVEKFHLEMKLVKIEYSFDRSKMLIYFTSDDRVDFRELVRDLASCFKTRIELRQIGVRDEAKLLGGIGPCGRILCCTSYLGNFAPVSIKMAKDQGLSLNPVKISGICGRLMCCLNNEQEAYEEAKRVMPDWGERVQTADGIGRVEGINILSRIVKVKLQGKEVAMDYDVSEIAKVK